MARRRAFGWSPWRLRTQLPASQVVVLPATAQGRELFLVLGLDWHTILGKDLAAQARRKARQQQATHWVHAGGRAESVGTVRLAARALAAGRLKAPREAHAAALLFARAAGAGVHAMAWRLSDGKCWLALTRDGQVLGGGDTVFGSTDRAARALQAAQTRFGGLQCAGDAVGLLTQPSMEGEAASFANHDLAKFAGAATPASALQSRLPGMRGVSAGVGGLVLLAVAVSAVPSLWQGRGHPEPDDTLAQTAGVPQEQDADRLWEIAITDFLAGTQLPTPQGLAMLWRTVGRMPLRPAGWLLREVRCELAQGAVWRCEANYRRLGRYASNEGFIERAWPDWTLRWSSLDDVSAVFQLPAEVAALSSSLPAAGPRFFPDADSLQRIRSLFSRVDVGLPQPLALAAPRDVNGSELPMPATLAIPRQRTIQLQGPMRSLALLGPSLTGRIAWRRFSLSLDPAARASMDGSILIATLSGVSYESQE